MGSIYSRANNTYTAHIRKKGFPQETKTFKTHEEAQRWVDEREAILNSLRDGNPSSGSIDDFLHVKSGKPRAILLRKYQTEAIQFVHRSLVKDSANCPLVVLPTGAGKTVVIAGLIERLLAFQPDARFLILTHTQELVVQDYEKFLEFSCIDAAYVGIASAGLGRVEMKMQVTFGTIQTIASRNFEGRVDYIIIDEAHMLPPSDDSLYRTFLNAAKQKNEEVRLIGFTATPFRLDSGLLTEGKNALFTEICYDANIRALIRDKYLSTLISTGSLHHVDDSKLVIVGNDFEEAAAEKAMKAITPSILDELLKYGESRKHWLVFCVSLAHAEEVTALLSQVGIKATTVSSAISTSEREARIRAYQEGRITALVNVNVLTTGFDAPHTDLIVSLRPTVSTSLWVQICGRGMRIHPNKNDCLVLDYANNIARHGPIDEIQVGDLQKSDGVTVLWDKKKATPCPSCKTLCGTRTFVCPNCGTLLKEQNSIELSQVASSLPVLKLNIPSENNHKRLVDLRDMLSWYNVKDIILLLRERVNDPQIFIEFHKYARSYQSLVESNAFYNGVYDTECTIDIEMLSELINKPVDSIKREIDDGTFPKPRLLISDDNVDVFGYSLMQVAVILCGDAQKLLQCDVTFLWYQHLIRILELELVAADIAL